jgi:hypothetical protein
MFYDELIWNWEEQGNFATASETAQPFENIDFLDPSLGDYPFAFLSK